jgi:hypothetical protein
VLIHLYRTFPLYEGGDPNARPTGGTARFWYSFTDDTWVQAPEIIGVLWKLVEIQEMNDRTTVIDDPDKYTLQLEPDGTLMVRGDCNLGGGSLPVHRAPPRTATSAIFTKCMPMC